MRSIPSEKSAEDVDTYFQTKGVFHRLRALITGTRFLTVLPPGFSEYVRQEALAATGYFFGPQVINGLFQSPNTHARS